jgi:Gpi18-like mannosyltransferase
LQKLEGKLTSKVPLFWITIFASALILRLVVAYTSLGIEYGFWIEDVKVIASGHILDFYNYWERGVYTYPPIWIIILTPIALVNPSVNEIVFLTKIPSIIADLLSAFIIYGICREKGIDGRVPALAWLFNPLGIYVSSNYGAFDGICVLFSLLSVFLIYKKKYVLSAISLALGVLTKQYVLLTALLLVPLLKNEVGVKKLIKPFLCFLAVIFAVCFPFFIFSPQKFVYVISGKAFLERENLGWLMAKPYANWCIFYGTTDSN